MKYLILILFIINPLFAEKEKILWQEVKNDKVIVTTNKRTVTFHGGVSEAMRDSSKFRREIKAQNAKIKSN